MKRKSINSLDSIFPSLKQQKICNNTNNIIYINDVNGLIYIPNFISQNEEENIISTIDNNEWETNLKRRVQQYGYSYNYKLRNITQDNKINDLPNWYNRFIISLKDTYNICLWDSNPDQMIINEYNSGQGISQHIDNEHIFKDIIISISLLSDTCMEFIPSNKLLKQNNNDKNIIKKSILLQRYSCLILTGESRYLWKHCIPSRKKDKNILNLQTNTLVDNIRSRRISITLRKIKF